jgi:hypothetical protein
MLEMLSSLAERIRKDHESLRGKAEQVRRDKPDLAVAVEKSPLDLSLCAVDGGLLSHRVHGADIVLARAAGVNFVYKDSTLVSHSYHPSRKPSPSLEYMDNLDEHEAGVFRSLVRLKHELGCALEMLERYAPDALLLDGSLLPVPADRPAESSALHPLYSEILSIYGKLFSRCQEKGTLLCGVTKDSRSRRLAKDYGLSCSDTLLFNLLLKQGERTKEITYSNGTTSKELKALGDQVKIFYLKPSESDIPLRIESLGSEIKITASLLLSLSSISERFAYPAVLIEADLCAAFDRKDVDSLQTDITSLSETNPLRRNSRPFR